MDLKHPWLSLSSMFASPAVGLTLWGKIEVNQLVGKILTVVKKKYISVINCKEVTSGKFQKGKNCKFR